MGGVAKACFPLDFFSQRSHLEQSRTNDFHSTGHFLTMGVGTYNYTFKSVVFESVKVKSVKIKNSQKP